MIQIRAVKLMFLVVGISMITAACAAPGASKVTENKMQNSGQKPNVTTLKIAGQEYPYSKSVLEAFDEKYPDIEVITEFSNLTVEEGTLQAALRSGNVGPDIILMNSGPGRVGVVAKEGLILQLDDLLAKNNILNRYQDWVVNQIKAQDQHGRVFELLEGVDVFQVYYNKEIFEQVGVNAPSTWEEFLRICQKLKDSGIQPISSGFNGGFGAGWFGSLLVEAAAGKDTMTGVIYGDGRFDQESIIQGGEMLKELVDKGYINGKETLALDQRQALPPFYNGKAAMTVIPQNVLLSVDVQGEIDVTKYGTFVIPSLQKDRPSRPAAGFANSWVVNGAIDKNKLPAVEKLLDFISSTEYLKLALDNGGTVIPVLKDVPENGDYTPIMKDAIEKLKNGAGYNLSVYLPGKVKAEWYSVLQGIVAKEITPKEAMSKLQQAKEQAK